MAESTVSDVQDRKQPGGARAAASVHVKAYIPHVLRDKGIDYRYAAFFGMSRALATSPGSRDCIAVCRLDRCEDVKPESVAAVRRRLRGPDATAVNATFCKSRWGSVCCRWYRWAVRQVTKFGARSSPQAHLAIARNENCRDVPVLVTRKWPSLSLQAPARERVGAGASPVTGFLVFVSLPHSL